MYAGSYESRLTNDVCITMASYWARWRLKSPASPLFAQPFIQAQIKENIKLRITGLCEGNSPVNSPQKGPVTRKMFPLDDVSMGYLAPANEYHIWGQHPYVASHSLIARLRTYAN